MSNHEIFMEALPYTCLFSFIYLIAYIGLIAIYKTCSYPASFKYFLLSNLIIGLICVQIGSDTNPLVELGLLPPFSVYLCLYWIPLYLCSVYTKKRKSRYCAYIDEVLENWPPLSYEEKLKIKAMIVGNRTSPYFRDITEYDEKRIREKWLTIMRDKLYDPFECVLMFRFNRPGRYEYLIKK